MVFTMKYISIIITIFLFTGLFISLYGINNSFVHLRKKIYTDYEISIFSNHLVNHNITIVLFESNNQELKNIDMLLDNKKEKHYLINIHNLLGNNQIYEYFHKKYNSSNIFVFRGGKYQKIFI